MATKGPSRSAEEVEQEYDAVDILLRDHEQVRALFRQFDGTTGAVSQRALYRVIRRELAIHESGEEVVVWPMVRRRIPRGAEIVAARVAEEQRSKELLATLEKLDPARAGFADPFRQLTQAVLSHAEHEEEAVFPALRQVQGGENFLIPLGVTLEHVKRTGPTRAHPRAPAKGPGLYLLGPVVGMLDRTRDRMGSRGRR